MQRVKRLTVVSVSVGLFALSVFPRPSLAQNSQDSSHWGVTGSFVPSWKAVPQLYDQLWDVDDFDPDGSEFRVGLVRGSDRGGDWSVTFIRNTIAVDRVFDDTQLQDVGNGQSVLFGSRFEIPKDPTIVGVKYEKFTPFVTIKDRVQIGLTYGGGVGALQSTVVDETRFDAEFEFDPNTGEQSVTPVQTSNQLRVEDFYKLSFVPIGSVEAAVSFLVAPGLKARVTGGFNFPNTHVFSVTINYLFGAQ